MKNSCTFALAVGNGGQDKAACGSKPSAATFYENVRVLEGFFLFSHSSVMKISAHFGVREELKKFSKLLSAGN